VALAVTEACSNAIRHAYPTGPGDILLDFDITNNAVIAIVSDQGVGIDAGTVDPGAGFGLRLIRAVSDTAIKSEPGHTRVEMRFARTPPTSPRPIATVSSGEASITGATTMGQQPASGTERDPAPKRTGDPARPDQPEPQPKTGEAQTPGLETDVHGAPDTPV
jgi:hypothetical protein